MWRAAPLATNGLVRVKKPPPRKQKNKNKDEATASVQARLGQHPPQGDFFPVRLEQIQLEQVRPRSSGHSSPKKVLKPD